MSRRIKTNQRRTDREILHTELRASGDDRTPAQMERLALVMAPLPQTRRIMPKTWAGAMITRDDFDLGRYGAKRSGAYDGGDEAPYYAPDSHQSI